MNLPLLSEVFPCTDKFAELYGGWCEELFFKRTFKSESFKNQIEQINAFLKQQGFEEEIEEEIFESKNFVEYNANFSFWKNATGYNQTILIYHKPIDSNPIKSILKLLDNFRNDRDWVKYHSSKNLSMAIGAEAGELLDLFLWDREKSVDSEKVKNELADIFTYMIYLADNWKIDLLDAVVEKLVINNEKYPIEKSKGTAKKYDEF